MNILKATYTEIYHKFFRIFQSTKVLDVQLRPVFNNEILAITILRTQMLLLVLLVIEVINLVIRLDRLYDLTYWQLFCGASLWLLGTAFIYSALFLYLGTEPKVPFTVRNLVVKSCWLCIVIGAMVFVFADLLERQSLNNYMLLTLAIGVIPLMSLLENLFFLLLCIGSCIGMAAYLHLPLNLVQQVLILSAMSLYAAQLRYASALNNFQEKQQLNQLNSELELLADTDLLTGLLNRRGLERRMTRLVRNHRRNGETICLLMLDIDFFKNYNDKYLHLAGDQCLANVAECLKVNARRSTDIIARYGGEEFVMVMQDMMIEELLSFALQIKNAIEDLHIPFDYDGFPYVTVSIGITIMTISDKDSGEDAILRDLLEQADQELYCAKANGRNCISYQEKIYR